MNRHLAPAAAAPTDLLITRGTRDDLAALAPFHYRARPPATIARILVAHDPNAEDDDPIGVLAVSMPALNSPLRDLAWPGRYRTGDKRADARRLNDEVRTISRVIVHPHHRGRGVARRLVRAYLDNPLTPATEALARSARRTRFFERAGMTRYDLPPPPHRARLLDAFAAVGLDPRRLPPPNPLPRSAVALLDRELRCWANASRRTRRLAAASFHILLAAAVDDALAPASVGYAHVSTGAPA